MINKKYGNVDFIEVNNLNVDYFLKKITDLEQLVLKKMDEEKKTGQFFDTGEEVRDYACSKENKVIVGVVGTEVVSAVYITQGQESFTYNDLTKYIKYTDDFKNYIRGTYDNTQTFQKEAQELYNYKLEAFKYAKNRYLSENISSNQTSFLECLKQSLIDNNGIFHEKVELRVKLLSYMYEYYMANCPLKDANEKYNKFFTFKLSDFNGQKNDPAVTEFETFLDYTSPIVHTDLSKVDFDLSQYYPSTSQNTIEIDTYITNPEFRSQGLSKIATYLALEQMINDFFETNKSDCIFLTSTLHENNLSSKYVSEFFELVNKISVQRRIDRTREVHWLRIDRNNYKSYLDRISHKLYVFYKFKASQDEMLTPEEEKSIIEAQRIYYENELARLKKIKESIPEDMQEVYDKKMILLNEKCKK